MLTPQQSSEAFIKYTILDAARIFGKIYTAQTLQEDFINLYKGQRDELDSVAPYLFAYSRETAFAKWLYGNGWGESWGIFIESDAGIEEVFNHLKKFIHLKTADGKDFFFRFYDPRVLRKLLIKYDADKLKTFFGPVKRFLCEDEDNSFAFAYSLDTNSKLVTERIHVSKIFDQPADKQKTEVTPLVKVDGPANKVNVELNANKPARKFFD